MTTKSNQIWVMAPEDIQAFWSEVRRAEKLLAAASKDTLANIEAAGRVRGMGSEKLYALNGGIATIPIVGPILKDVPFWWSFFGVKATSTMQTRAAIIDAIADQDAHTIVLDIDSPGGSVAGLVALADEVFAARQSGTRVLAYAQDMACSAAYWVGAQAEEFTAGRGARIGCIGVYSVSYDTSKLYEEEGIEAIVSASGGVKGGLVDGAPISDEVKKDLQREVNEIASEFIEAVAKGRNIGVKEARELADGRTWPADLALSKNLIDAIETDRTLAGRIAGGVKHKTASAEGASMEVGTMTEPKKEIPPSDALVAQLAKQEKEIAALKKEMELEASRADAAEASLGEIIAKQKEKLLDAAQSAGKITPATRDIYEGFAEKCGGDTEKLEAALEKLPVVLKTEPAGSVNEAPKEGETGAHLSAEDKAMAEALGLDESALLEAQKVGPISITGNVEGVN